MILRERSLFIVPPRTKQSPKDLIISLVSQLSPKQRDQFNALSHHAHPTAKDDEIPLAKFETNAISAGDNLGIFPRTSRLNHGCSSAFNVAYSWRNDEQVLGMFHSLWLSLPTDLFSTVTYSFKPIAEGEELLTAYTDTKKPRHERQEYLQQAYNFRCQCTVCSFLPEESKLSDERLVKMAKLKVDLSAWEHRGIGGKEATTIINEIWRTGEEEGYWSEYVFPFYIYKSDSLFSFVQTRRFGMGCYLCSSLSLGVSSIRQTAPHNRSLIDDTAKKQLVIGPC